VANNEYIHENGDCSAVDASSASGHNNPHKSSQGSSADMTHHEVDMGNMEAGYSGKAYLNSIDASLALVGAKPIIGRSIIIHKNEDDLKTQP
jgi:superoxide dismutase, Cu-Zn family